MICESQEREISWNASNEHCGLISLTKYFKSQGVGTDPMLRWMDEEMATHNGLDSRRDFQFECTLRLTI